MNEVYFSKEEIEAGLHTKLINFLIEKSYADQGDLSYYSDIRVVPEDMGAIVVKWNDVCWDSEWNEGEHWHWVDSEHVVMKEVIFPDNHTEFRFDGEEADAIKEWLEENPGWVKNNYGVWSRECY